VRADLTEVAWEYRWSSAAAYVRAAEDGLTDRNPYVGVFTEQDRRVYGEELMTGADEKVVKELEGMRAMGTSEFASMLKMERGRYRLKRGKPVNAVRITS